MISTPTLRSVVEALEGVYGPPPPPFPVDPFELVLWENAAYLVDDDRRREAFESLRTTVGTRPGEILGASHEQLLEVTSHGILPEIFADKLRAVAETALREFDGDLGEVVKRPAAAAKRALRRLPGIGEPGAEKILLFTRSHPFLAPESNGLRVMVRLGIVADGMSYSRTYRAARDVAERELGEDFDALLAARHLLRQHGKEICRRKAPSCESCTLGPVCPFP
jgi:endonuclease-3